jgi:hypothetical protein
MWKSYGFARTNVRERGGMEDPDLNSYLARNNKISSFNIDVSYFVRHIFTGFLG